MGPVPIRRKAPRRTPQFANQNGPQASGEADGTGLDECAGLQARLDALQAETQTLRSILGSALDYAIVTMDSDGLITSWSTGAERIVGYTEAEVLGRSGEILFTAEDRAAGVFAEELQRARAHGTATNERWHLRRDGTRFWASGTMMPLQDPGRQPHGFLNILRDRTEQRAEAERQEMLVGEMSHRIKNTFAVVQAVAARSSRHAGTPAEFLAAFDARLRALATSHDVLIRAGWEDAPLREVVTQALAPYADGSIRIADGCPAAALPATLVVTVSLALHELATNAAKHGALSVPDGSVDVSWTIEDAVPGVRMAHLVWREAGGPPVRAPARRGFGSHLLERGTGGAARLEFRPEGLQCHMMLAVGSGA